MKQLVISFFVIFMLMLPTVAEAQHVILGEGSNFNSPYSYPSPYGTYYRNQRTQILVTKNELYSIGLVPEKSVQ
jgi:hypothetical protein